MRNKKASTARTIHLFFRALIIMLLILRSPFTRSCLIYCSFVLPPTITPDCLFSSWFTPSSISKF